MAEMPYAKPRSKKRPKLLDIHPLLQQIGQIGNTDFLDQIEAAAHERRVALDLEEKRAWIDEALQSPHEIEWMCAKAMNHFVFGSPPGRDFAYIVADAAKEIQKWRCKHKGSIPNWVDITSYVFRHTHYDECDNGYFFRRS